jgi:hypothetical protein
VSDIISNGKSSPPNRLECFSFFLSFQYNILYVREVPANIVEDRGT